MRGGGQQVYRPGNDLRCISRALAPHRSPPDRPCLRRASATPRRRRRGPVAPRQSKRKSRLQPTRRARLSSVPAAAARLFLIYTREFIQFVYVMHTAHIDCRATATGRRTEKRQRRSGRRRPDLHDGVRRRVPEASRSPERKDGRASPACPPEARPSRWAHVPWVKAKLRVHPRAGTTNHDVSSTYGHRPLR